MANVVEGLVAVKMDSKFGDDKRIKLEDGGWYSATPAMADKIRKGAVVKLKVERRGKSEFVEAVKELEAPAAGSSGGGNRSGGGGGGKSGGMSKEDWEAKDKAIQYQSSRNAAIELLKLENDLGILKLGSKAAEKEAILLAHLDRLTAELFNDIGTLGAVSRYVDQTDEGDEFPEEESGEEDDDFGEDDTDEDDF